MYSLEDVPEYQIGYWYSVRLSFLCISALASTIYLIVCMVLDLQRGKGLSEHLKKMGDGKALLGDLDPYYRHTL
jgi:hypothetical protein